MAGKMMNEKMLALYLTGQRNGAPTLDDITALFRKLTGREPTPEDVATSKALLDAHLATQRSSRRQG
jgi:hypothetical protein